MANISQKDLFARLGAPLANQRRSWGGVRDDGTVVLRVWQDEDRNYRGRWCVRITKRERFEGTNDTGYLERLEHIELIRAGARSYLVMCEAVDVNAVPREMKDFNGDEVFVGGEIIEIDGDLWIVRGQRIPVREAAIK